MLVLPMSYVQHGNAGNTVDLATIDALAFKEMESGTVLVYRRFSVDADTWLMAQAASQMRVVNK